MSEAIAIRPAEEQALQRATPADMIREATAQADALSGLIEKQKLYSMIQGRKYVRVEGWVPLARMNNVIPREVENVALEDGRYVARVQLVRLTDGMVLTEASGECGGPDEPMWQNRPPYARRSMAATRATGKACRLAYSWIISLAGFEPTPAEEMDGVADARPVHAAPVQRPNADHARERQERQVVTEDGGTWTGTIAKVRQVTGKTKNGQEWVLNVVEGGDGTEFGTFDTGLADMARIAEGGANRVKITWEKSKKGGRNIVRIEDAEGVFDGD